MLILGLVLFLLGWLLVVPLLQVIGVMLLIVGVVLWAMGYAGCSVAGRRYWW